MERLRKLSLSLALFLPCLQWTTCFNLDIDKPYVFSGPEGSYFGFSVDFFQPDAKQSNILIGAPKANTSSASTVVERGAVYTCPWQKSSDCTQVQFDNTEDSRFATDQLSCQVPQHQVVLRDTGFPSHQIRMHPYPGVHLNKPGRTYNYRHSRCRRVIENAFSDMTARMRIRVYHC